MPLAIHHHAHSAAGRRRKQINRLCHTRAGVAIQPHVQRQIDARAPPRRRGAQLRHQAPPGLLRLCVFQHGVRAASSQQRFNHRIQRLCQLLQPPSLAAPIACCGVGRLYGQRQQMAQIDDDVAGCCLPDGRRHAPKSSLVIQVAQQINARRVFVITEWLRRHGAFFNKYLRAVNNGVRNMGPAPGINGIENIFWRQLLRQREISQQLNRVVKIHRCHHVGPQAQQSGLFINQRHILHHAIGRQNAQIGRIRPVIAARAVHGNHAIAQARAKREYFCITVIRPCFHLACRSLRPRGRAFHHNGKFVFILLAFVLFQLPAQHGHLFFRHFPLINIGRLR